MLVLSSSGASIVRIVRECVVVPFASCCYTVVYYFIAIVQCSAVQYGSTVIHAYRTTV